MNLFKLSKAIYFALIIILMEACYQATTDSELQQRIKISEEKLEQIDPLPNIKDYPGYKFDVEKSRNPFEFAKVLEAPKQDLRPSKDRKREVLEQSTLESLKMVGFLSQNNDSWALIQDKNGIIYRVGVGNYLGQDEGKIIGINENKILIHEVVLNEDGEWVEKESSLLLNK